MRSVVLFVRMRLYSERHNIQSAPLLLLFSFFQCLCLSNLERHHFSVNYSPSFGSPINAEELATLPAAERYIVSQCHALVQDVTKVSTGGLTSNSHMDKQLRLYYIPSSLLVCMTLQHSELTVRNLFIGLGRLQLRRCRQADL
jgi:hypothetical protein